MKRLIDFNGDNQAVFEYLSEKSANMDLLEFITDKEAVGITTDSIQEFMIFSEGDVMNKLSEDRITNAAHVRLAHLWLLCRGLTKPKGKQSNMFGVN